MLIVHQKDKLQLLIINSRLSSESVIRVIYVKPFKTQLLKWIGNKQRFAQEIIDSFPSDRARYFEPFLGSGAVLGTLHPKCGYASDIFEPLIQIWKTVKTNPKLAKQWYQERWKRIAISEKVSVYEEVKASYNRNPNGADLLFLCRSCYGGVMRFRKSDGYISTPCGIHDPIPPESFDYRVDVWNKRIQGVQFDAMDYREAMARTQKGDVVYCDPPYTHSQAILYRGHEFRLEELMGTIAECKSRGVRVVLSIDGSKKSGADKCALPIPDGLFEEEVFIDCGRSMLRRFQMGGETLESEQVKDRLLLTY